MAETFVVNCLGCGETKELITTHAGTVGIHCSCGASVDIKARDVDE